MAPPRLTDEQLREAVQAVEDAFASGVNPSNLGAAAAFAMQRLGVLRQTIYDRLRFAKERLGLEPDESAYRPLRYIRPSPGQPFMLSESHFEEATPDGEPLDIVAIGDLHDSPHLPDKSRFEWIGAYIEEHQVKRVVQLGDWLTMDSFSSHTERGTIEGMSKPTFDQDLDSFHNSMRAYQRGLGGTKPVHDFIEGNHCLRAKRWANQHPEAMGTTIDPAFRLKEAFTQWGWRWTNYGEYRFIGGVGFIHAPLNAVGKAIGGKTGNQRIANDATFDIIRGDDHKFNVACAARHGPVKPVRVYSIGCALPLGFIEGYASKSLNDWESGITRLKIWGGRVIGFEFIGMALLKHRYGSRLAA